MKHVFQSSVTLLKRLTDTFKRDVECYMSRKYKCLYQCYFEQGFSKPAQGI